VVQTGNHPALATAFLKWMLISVEENFPGVSFISSTLQPEFLLQRGAKEPWPIRLISSDLSQVFGPFTKRHNLSPAFMGT